MMRSSIMRRLHRLTLPGACGSPHIRERVAVEAGTILVCWVGSRSSAPVFAECKLLWPGPPHPPGDPLPLSFRLVDFTADVSMEDADVGLPQVGDGKGRW
jgi:hypothetical protein